MKINCLIRKYLFLLLITLLFQPINMAYPNELPSQSTSFDNYLLPIPNLTNISNSKVSNYKYSTIINYYKNNNNNDSLIIKQIQNLLKSCNDELSEDEIISLINICSNSYLQLKYKTNSSKINKNFYLIEFVHKLYNEAKTAKYKFYLWKYITNKYHEIGKFDELVENSIKAKKEIYNSLNFDNKFLMAYIIAYYITYHSKYNDKYYIIGEENCNQAINLILFTNYQNYSSLEEKRILKLYFRLKLSTELYAKYKKYNEAVYELDTIINSPPPLTRPKLNNCINVYKTILENIKNKKEK